MPHSVPQRSATTALTEALRLDAEDLRAGYNLAVARNGVLRGR